MLIRCKSHTIKTLAQHGKKLTSRYMNFCYLALRVIKMWLLLQITSPNRADRSWDFTKWSPKAKAKPQATYGCVVPFCSDAWQHKKVSSGLHTFVLEHLGIISFAQHSYNAPVSIFLWPLTHTLSRYFEEISTEIQGRPQMNPVTLAYIKDINKQ